LKKSFRSIFLTWSIPVPYLFLFVTSVAAQNVEPYDNQMMKYLHQEAKLNRDRVFNPNALTRPEAQKLRDRIKQSDRLILGKGKSNFVKNSQFRKVLANLDEISRGDAFDVPKISRLFGVAQLKPIVVSDSLRGSTFEMIKFEMPNTQTNSSCAIHPESAGNGSLRLVRNVSSV
jgi:hypothetical protein